MGSWRDSKPSESWWPPTSINREYDDTNLNYPGLHWDKVTRVMLRISRCHDIYLSTYLQQLYGVRSSCSARSGANVIKCILLACCWSWEAILTESFLSTYVDNKLFFLSNRQQATFPIIFFCTVWKWKWISHCVNLKHN